MALPALYLADVPAGDEPQESEVAQHLADALAILRRGRPTSREWTEARAELLIRAWSACRAKEIGAAIELLEMLDGRAMPARFTSAEKAMSLREVREALVKNSLLGPDPRLLRPYLQVASSTVDEATRDQAIELARGCLDCRSLDVLDAHAKGIDTARLTVLRDAIPARPLLPADARAHFDGVLAEILSQFDRPRAAAAPRVFDHGAFRTRHADRADLAQLLAFIMTNPSDEDARLVYADALLEAGDPRGEFVALQHKRAELSRRYGRMAALDKEETRKERGLLREHWIDWVSPLGTILDQASMTFSLGFLDACTVRADLEPERAALIGHPTWATVRELTCDDARLVSDPVMRGLETLITTPAVLSQVARAEHPVNVRAIVGPYMHIHGIRVRTGVRDPLPVAAWGDALRVGALSNVRRLALDVFRIGGPVSVDELMALLESPLCRQLDEIGTFGYWQVTSLAPWAAVMLDTATSLRRVVIRFMDGDAGSLGRVLVTLALERTDGVMVAKLHLAVPWARAAKTNAPDKIARALVGFPRPEIPTLEVSYASSARTPEREDFASLHGIVGRLFRHVLYPTKPSFCAAD